MSSLNRKIVDMPREKAVMGPSKPLKTGFWTSFRRGVCNLIGNHAHEDMISMILSDIKQIYTLEDFFKYTFDPYGKGGLVYLQDRTYPEALFVVENRSHIGFLRRKNV